MHHTKAVDNAAVNAANVHFVNVTIDSNTSGYLTQLAIFWTKLLPKKAITNFDYNFDLKSY